MFSIAKNQYLMLADRISGYLFVEDMGKTTTSEKVTERLEKLYNMYGMPRACRHDDGPHFRGPWKNFLKEIKCESQQCCAYNHESAGLAEISVKLGKYLLTKFHQEQMG